MKGSGVRVPASASKSSCKAACFCRGAIRLGLSFGHRLALFSFLWPDALEAVGKSTTSWASEGAEPVRSKDNSPIKGNLGRDSVGSAKIPAWHEPESQEVHFGRPGEGRRDRLRDDHRHVSPCGRGEAIPTPPLAAGRPCGRQRSRSLARARLLARTGRESQGRTSRDNRRALLDCPSW